MTDHIRSLVATFGDLPSNDVPEADPLRNPLDAFRLDVARQLHSSLDIPVEKAFEAVSTASKVADFSVAFPRFKLPGKPNDVAEKAYRDFQPSAYIAEASHQGAFVHYKVNHETMAKLTLATITELSSRGEDKGDAPSASKSKGSIKSAYGHNESGKGQRMIIEFSSPNIAKPFHAGHLRSTIIGAFLSNLYEANGWYVERWNYLGDWGKQFGLLAVGWERSGDEAKLKEDPIKHLYDVYVEVNAAAEADPSLHEKARVYFKGMEDGDESALALWRKFRDLSIAKYEETYARLNIHFDVYSGESQVTKQSISSALDAVRDSEYVERAENGAMLIDLTKYKLEKTVIERADGTALYISRDLAEAKKRWNLFKEKYGAGFDKMIYVVASQQDLHLAQFFKILDLSGFEGAKALQHVNFGMVLGMSTRKGTAVFLDKILEEAQETMESIMKQNEDRYKLIEDPQRVAYVLGESGVKIQDLTGKRHLNYEFSWKRCLSNEGDTGVFLQYNHVRLCSVVRKAASEYGFTLPSTSSGLHDIDTTLFSSEPKAQTVVMLLASWPDVVRSATRDQQPSTVVHFAFRLARAISSAWEVLIVKGAERDTAMARLYLFDSTRVVLAAALELLTLSPLQRM